LEQRPARLLELGLCWRRGESLPRFEASRGCRSVWKSLCRSLNSWGIEETEGTDRSVHGRFGQWSDRLPAGTE
jgi:hypothetical protein